MSNVVPFRRDPKSDGPFDELGKAIVADIGTALTHGLQRGLAEAVMFDSQEAARRTRQRFRAGPIHGFAAVPWRNDLGGSGAERGRPTRADMSERKRVLTGTTWTCLSDLIEWPEEAHPPCEGVEQIRSEYMTVGDWSLDGQVVADRDLPDDWWGLAWAVHRYCDNTIEKCPPEPTKAAVVPIPVDGHREWVGDFPQRISIHVGVQADDHGTALATALTGRHGRRRSPCVVVEIQGEGQSVRVHKEPWKDADGLAHILSELCERLLKEQEEGKAWDLLFRTVQGKAG